MFFVVLQIYELSRKQSKLISIFFNMKNIFLNQDEEILQQFEIEELEQRLEMKMDWQQNGSVILPGGDPYPIVP